MPRSHVGRPLDLSLPSNRLIVGIVGLTAIGVLARVLTIGGPVELWLAPVHAFLVWALTRELDPDHDWTAIVAGLVTGAWVLVGLDISSLLTTGGLLLAARLVLNSTGLRPLNTDLGVLVLGAALISFTRGGWVAGFTLAVAIYIDERLSDEPRPAGVIAAALAALGSSVVATLADAFPQEVPDIRPVMVAVVGALALVAVTREPLPPLSLVDHGDRLPMRQPRLHGARGLIGVAVFVATILAGAEAAGFTPVILALALALVSDAVERLRMEDI